MNKKIQNHNFIDGYNIVHTPLLIITLSLLVTWGIEILMNKIFLLAWVEKISIAFTITEQHFDAITEAGYEKQ